MFIPFIFLTAKRQKEDRLYGLKLGADDYISKPFEPEELVLRIQNTFAKTPPLKLHRYEVLGLSLKYAHLNFKHFYS